MKNEKINTFKEKNLFEILKYSNDTDQEFFKDFKKENSEEIEAAMAREKLIRLTHKMENLIDEQLTLKNKEHISLERYNGNNPYEITLVRKFKNYLMQHGQDEKFLKNFISSEFVGSKFENIVDSANGKTKKFEVLLEINDSLMRTMGYKHRGVFLRKLEEKNSSQYLTYNHFNNISKLEENLSKDGKHDYTYSVNIGTRELSSEITLNKLNKLEKEGLIDKVQLEFLENISLDFLEKTVGNTPEENLEIKNRDKILEKIKSLGLKINLDDYGSGHSNIEKIKYIQKKFTNQLHSVKLDKDIVIYSSMYTQILTEKDKNKRNKIFNNHYEKNKDSLYTSIMDISDVMKEKNIDSFEKMNENIDNLENNGEISSIFNAIKSLLEKKGLNKEQINKKFFELIKKFQNFDEKLTKEKKSTINKVESEIEIEFDNKNPKPSEEEKKKEKNIRIDFALKELKSELFKEIDTSIMKPIMKQRMSIVHSESIELSKYLSKLDKNITVIAEYAEKPENFYQILKRFNINLFQGYDVFDNHNLITINNKENNPKIDINKIDINKEKTLEFINDIHQNTAQDIKSNFNTYKGFILRKKPMGISNSLINNYIKNLNRNELNKRKIKTITNDLINEQTINNEECQTVRNNKMEMFDKSSEQEIINDLKVDELNF